MRDEVHKEPVQFRDEVSRELSVVRDPIPYLWFLARCS